jgi:glyoxylase-like metal-dependent hydrolase (beta-lactamase superfamily II)
MLKYTIIPVTSYQQNCSLVWCDQTREAALIDPGGEVKKLIAELNRQALQLTQIWLTHGHMDHVGGAQELAQEYSIDILGPHQDDAFWLQQLEQQCTMFQFPMVASFTPDHWLRDKQRLSLGNEQFEIRHTPGHTPGHIVFVHHPAQCVWVGDVLFKRSIGRTDFPKGSHAELLDSIYNTLFTLPGNYQFIPGHGPSGYLEDEQQHNPHLSRP